MAKAKISKGRYLRAINKSCRKELYKSYSAWDDLEWAWCKRFCFKQRTLGTGFLRSWSQQCHQQSRPQAENICQKSCQRCTCKHSLEREQEMVFGRAARTEHKRRILQQSEVHILQYVSRKYEASSSSYFHSKLWIWIVGCLGSCWVRAMYFTDHAGKIVHSLKPSYRPKGLPQSGNTGKVGKVGKVFSAHHFKSVCIRVEVWSPNSKKPAILLIRASPDLPPPRETIMKGCHTKIRSLGVEGTVVSIRFQSISAFIATLKVEHKTHHLIEFFRWIENHHVSPLILAPWTKIRLLWQ